MGSSATAATSSTGSDMWTWAAPTPRLSPVPTRTKASNTDSASRQRAVSNGTTCTLLPVPSNPCSCLCVSFVWVIFMLRWINKSHWIHPGVPLDIGIIIFNTFMQMLFVHCRECCIFLRTEDCYITRLWLVNCKSFPVWCEFKRRMKIVMVCWLFKKIPMNAWTIQLFTLRMPRTVHTGLNEINHLLRLKKIIKLIF